MKLAPRDLPGFVARPDPRAGAMLLYGADAMRVALRRQDLLAALLGPNAAEEMRLTRIPAAELRRDPAQLGDALRAQGFFPGQRAVLVEDATDAAAPAITAALEDRTAGDAFLLVTAGALPPRSALRKLFEAHRTALAAAVYEDAPGRDEIARTLKAAGLDDVAGEAMHALTGMAQALDPGDFRQTVEKLALYMLDADAPASADDVAAIAPASGEAVLDRVVDSVADGARDQVAAALPRLAAQGVAPTSVCIALQRHFSALHAAAAHPEGASKGLAAMRPPVFGPRRDAMQRQLRAWNARALEDALRQIMDADLALRSTRPPPARAHVERLMIRLAMSHPR